MSNEVIPPSCVTCNTTTTPKSSPSLPLFAEKSESLQNNPPTPTVSVSATPQLHQNTASNTSTSADSSPSVKESPKKPATPTVLKAKKKNKRNGKAAQNASIKKNGNAAQNAPNKKSSKAAQKAPKKRGDTLLIVGLGNPGASYRNTPHNVGFEMVDAYAEDHAAPAFRQDPRHDALMTAVKLFGRTVLLAKPTTCMNLSGDAIRSIRRSYRVPVSAVLVIADDVSLDVGEFDMRTRGAVGGHNGLRSVQHALGGNEFARVQVGVGSPEKRKDLADYVLAKLPRADQQALRKVETEIADVLDNWVQKEA